MHRWHTYAQRQPDHVNLEDLSSEEEEEDPFKQDIGLDVVALKDDNQIDNEGAYYLEQQRMNFFGVGRKDKDMRRRKKNTNFDLVLQRRLPLKKLSPIEPPPSYREGARSKQASRAR